MVSPFRVVKMCIRDSPHAKAALPVVQNLMWQGEYRKAQYMCTEKIMSNTNFGMPYEPFGDVYISAPGMDDYSRYYRELDVYKRQTMPV